MSNFTHEAVHPQTREIKRAYFFDDYFGKHQYGVQFVDENKVYRLSELPSKDTIQKEANSDE